MTPPVAGVYMGEIGTGAAPMGPVPSDETGIGMRGSSDGGRPGGTGGGEILGSWTCLRRIVRRVETGMGIFGSSSLGRDEGVGGGEILGSDGDE